MKYNVMQVMRPIVEEHFLQTTNMRCIFQIVMSKSNEHRTSAEISTVNEDLNMSRDEVPGVQYTEICSTMVYVRNGMLIEMVDARY